jgi:hypothetical protein
MTGIDHSSLARGDKRRNRCFPSLSVDPWAGDELIRPPAKDCRSASIYSGRELGQFGEEVTVQGVYPRPQDTRQIGHLALRSTGVGFPAAKVGPLNDLRRLDLPAEERAGELRVEAMVGGSARDVREECRLPRGVLDGGLLRPFVAGHIVHHLQALPHQTQESVERPIRSRCQGRGRRGRRAAGRGAEEDRQEQDGSSH